MYDLTFQNDLDRVNLNHVPNRS